MKVRWKLRCCTVGLEEIEDFLLLLFFDTGSLRKSPPADLVWRSWEALLHLTKVRWKLRCCTVGLEEIDNFLLLLFFDTGSLRKSPAADLIWEVTGSASSF